MGKNTRKLPNPSTPTRQSSRLAEKTPADRSSDESDASNSAVVTDKVAEKQTC